MENLDLVDDRDNVIGRVPIEEAHSKGLRHRSVQVLVFKEQDLETLLVAQRIREIVSGGKFHPSVGGHVKSGQSYLEAGLDELREELFYEMTELPRGITLVEVAKYQNDSRPTNKENTYLYYCVYEGPFSHDPTEIESIEWLSRHRVWNDMLLNPNKYTQTFVNAMHQFKLWISRKEPV